MTKPDFKHHVLNVFSDDGERIIQVAQQLYSSNISCNWEMIKSTLIELFNEGLIYIAYPYDKSIEDFINCDEKTIEDFWFDITKEGRKELDKIDEWEQVDNGFVGYVGSSDIHDGIVEEIIEEENNNIRVVVKSYGSKRINMTFEDVKLHKANSPIGMMLYAIAELKEDIPYRKFEFVNWDEENNSSLQIIARSFRIEEY